MPGDQRFDPGDENRSFADDILYSPQTTGKLIDIGDLMPLSNERVQLRKAAVLEADARRSSLTKLTSEKARIVEIAEAAIPVNEHWQLS